MTRRLVLTYLVVTATVLVALVVPLGTTYADRQRRQVTAALERDAFVLATFVQDGLEAGALTAAMEARAGDYAARSGARVVVVDERGLALVDTDPPLPGERNFASRPEVASALAGRVAVGRRSSDTLGGSFTYVAVPVASGGAVHGVVRVTYSSAVLDTRVRRYWLTLALVAGVSLLAVGGIGVVLARTVTRPVRRLETAAADLGAGDLTARAPADDGPPEVRALAESFNRTAARLQSLVERQETFVADASHELRTPVTALRLRLENLEPELTAAGREALDDVLGEVERLARVVDGLLVLARADRAPTRAPVRLVAADVLTERRDTWAALADERRVTLAVEGPADVTVTADPDRLAQVLDNLLANALEAVPDASVITLVARREAQGTALHVIDQGPGLDPEQRRRATDRFWRAEQIGRVDTGGPAAGGSGLGLAIVARLVAVDGGTVRLDEAPGGGLDAVVTLPA